MPPGSVAFFGSSSVYGVGDEQGGFVHRFRLQYEKVRPEVTVYDLGIPAENTNYLIKRFSDERDRRNPSLVIFEIGTNDAYREGSEHGERAIPIDRFRENVETLVQTALESSAVGIIAPFPVLDSANPHKAIGENPHAYYLSSDVHEYSEVLKEVAAKYNVPVLDLFSIWQKKDEEGSTIGESYLGKDGLHANTKGHQEISRLLLDFVIENYDDGVSLEHYLAQEDCK